MDFPAKVWYNIVKRRVTMHIWLGIDLDSQLQELKNLLAQIRTKTGMPLENPNFPMHTSLKISFQIPDQLVPQVVDELCNYFATQKPFQLQLDKPECHPNIAWMLYKPHPQLVEISNYLNNYLLANYNVPLHEYDTDFKYHTTLFIDGTTEQVATAYSMLQHFPFPQTLTANTFCIGFSESGANYTYQVTRRVVVG